MLITYGVFGVFANLALFVHIAFIFAGLVLLGSTLTLPGIAGIVLTIGMAVDSNVLIYERIREEQHAGRSILASLDAGFNRAFATIVDSNVTMFVAAAILYFLGLGPGARLRRVAGARHFDDHRDRRDHDAHDDRGLVSLCASDAACRSKGARHHETPAPRPGEHQIPVHAVPPRELSVLGGSFDHRRAAVRLLRHEFRHRFRRRHGDRAARQGTARRKSARCARLAKSSSSATSKCRLSAIRPTPRCASACSPAATRRSRPRSSACAARSATDYDIRRVEVVGPRVSGELVQSGTLGVVLSIIAVLGYLWFRFEWQFAISAVIATMHDLLLTVGFFSLTQLEFNTTSIAAILTIVGYSLNETVVVLDRIREMMRKYKKMPTAQIIDMSINAVLPRTIMTATTVFLALLSLDHLRRPGDPLLLAGDDLGHRRRDLFLGVHLLADADLSRPAQRRRRARRTP